MILVQHHTRRHGICNSCTSEDDISDIKVSTTDNGWTTIMLCKSCRKELADKLIEHDKRRG